MDMGWALVRQDDGERGRWQTKVIVELHDICTNVNVFK